MKNRPNELFLVGTMAAMGASLCCITPVLSILAGLGGAASMLAWLEPFRPYLIGLSLLVLAFAWYQKLAPNKQTMSCDCETEENIPFVQSKAFLGVVTVLVLLLLAFPYYSGAFIPEPMQNVGVQRTALQQARLEIRGMTCTGCEGSVNYALTSKKGVLAASANYEEGMARVIYDPALITPKMLQKAIEQEVGYTVTNFELTASKK